MSSVKDKAAASAVAVGGMICRPSIEDICKVMGTFHLRCLDRFGNLEWECDAHNSLTDEGKNLIRDIIFKGAANIGDSVYVGLSTANPMLASATLASGVTEATGGGYTRKQVVNANWATPGTGQANNTANPAIWTAASTQIANVYEAFITNASSGTGGKLITHAVLTNGPYTVNVGSTLNATYSWSIS